MQKLPYPSLLIILLFLSSVTFSQAFNPEKVLAQFPPLPASLEENAHKADKVPMEQAFTASSAFHSYFKSFSDQLLIIQSSLQKQGEQNETSGVSEANAIMKSKGVDVSKLDLDKLSEMSDEEAQKYLLNNVKKQAGTNKTGSGSNSLSMGSVKKMFIDPLNTLHAQYAELFSNNNSELFAPFEKEKARLGEAEYKELQNVPKIASGEYTDMPDPAKTRIIKLKYETLQKEVTQKEFTKSKQYFNDYKQKLMALSAEFSKFIQTNQNKKDVISVNATAEVQNAFYNAFQDDLLVAAQNICFLALIKVK